MMLREWTYQAATKVNVLSHEISIIVEVDAVHKCGRRNINSGRANGKRQRLYRGLRQWHGMIWNICKLGRSIKLHEWYCKTSSREQGLRDGLMEVGLIDSTRRAGKLLTWGSDQQRCKSLSDNADTQRSGKHHE